MNYTHSRCQFNQFIFHAQHVCMRTSILDFSLPLSSMSLLVSFGSTRIDGGSCAVWGRVEVGRRYG